MRRSEADRNAAFMRTEGRSRRRLTAFQRFQRGAIKTVGPSHMECGGKRSATPLWLVFVPYPSPRRASQPKRRRASLAAALHKVPELDRQFNHTQIIKMIA